MDYGGKPLIENRMYVHGSEGLLMLEEIADKTLTIFTSDGSRRRVMLEPGIDENYPSRLMPVSNMEIGLRYVSVLPKPKGTKAWFREQSQKLAESPFEADWSLEELAASFETHENLD